MNKIKNYFKRLFDIIKKPEMKVLPGGLAFFLFLSLVPIITLVLYISSILSIGTDSVRVFVDKVLTKDISNILVPYISDVGIDINTILFMITGFLVASNGSQSLITTSNVLYKIESKGYFKRLIKSLLMTILLVILFVFIIFVLAFGDKIINFITNIETFINIKQEILVIYSILKWPIGILFIFLILKLLYTLAPDKKIKSKYMNRGAIFTTIMWVVVTIMYSFYINNYANYNLFYGSLANIVIIMLWMYALSFILVIGMAINNEYYSMDN